MDRFIESTVIWVFTLMVNLKSNMDRFIGRKLKLYKEFFGI